MSDLTMSNNEMAKALAVMFHPGTLAVIKAHSKKRRTLLSNTDMIQKYTTAKEYAKVWWLFSQRWTDKCSLPCPREDSSCSCWRWAQERADIGDKDGRT